MQRYHTARSDEGLRLPPSGVLIGLLSEALRLKSVLRDDFPAASYKTVQRYFEGKRIEPETVEAVLQTLVEALVPPGLRLPPEQVGFDLAVGDLVVGVLRQYSQRWDWFAADVNDHSYPTSNEADLPVPVLRLLALDLGLRYGAWLVLQDLLDREPVVLPEWFPDRGLATVIDPLRETLGLTIEEVANDVGVSTQSVEAWRSGTSLPTSDHIIGLARALCPDPVRRRVTELRFRLVVGVHDVYRRLVAVCGEARIRDMTLALLRTASLILAIHKQSQSTESPPSLDLLEIAAWRRRRTEALEGLPPRMWNVVMHGAACPVGAHLCELFARESALRQEVAADFLALPGNWRDRGRYWMRFLGSAPRELALLRHAEETGEFPPGFAENLGPSIFEAQLRMAGFDRKPGPEMQVFRVSHPSRGKAMNRVVQAEREASLDNLAGAIEHARAAVKHQPLDAGLHFSLGAYLGQLGARERHQPTMQEAIDELQIAVAIDPAFGNARNEIGIVLSNMRRHEDAEQAFSEAEPYHGEHAHHWVARGNNYLGLGDRERARASYEKAIELSKGSTHTEASMRLAATLMALGRTREARNLGKRVRHTLGADPTDEWQRVLDVWGDFRFVEGSDEADD